MLQVNIFDKTDSVFNQYLAELRDVSVQQDRMRFRRNLERIGEIMGYEISKTFEYENKEVTTPLGIKEVRVLKHQPVVATILRAGLPFHTGLLHVFDWADNAFVAAYRKYDKNDGFEIKMEYASSANLDNRVLIICDPMLATGESIVKTLKGLLNDQTPSHIHVAVAVASVDGLNYVRRVFANKPVTLWVGSVDEELTAHAYIVPGLGDAGDLAFGEKR